MSLMRRKESDVVNTPLLLRDEVNRLFDNVFGPGPLVTSRENPWRGSYVPPMDIAETENAVIVTTEVPGMKPEEIRIDLTGNILTLRGEKKEESEEKGRNWHRLERSYGSFSRSIHLPETVDPDTCKATSENGVLRIEIGKSEASRPRSIKVDVKRG